MYPDSHAVHVETPVHLEQLALQLAQISEVWSGNFLSGQVVVHEVPSRYPIKQVKHYEPEVQVLQGERQFVHVLTIRLVVTI